MDFFGHLGRSLWHRVDKAGDRTSLLGFTVLFLRTTGLLRKEYTGTIC